MKNESYNPAPDETLHARATAYVFGELSGIDAISFEAELAESTPLQETVASIRETVSALQTEFNQQSPSLSEEGKQRIAKELAGPNIQSVDEPVDLGRRPRRIGWIVSLVVAASVLLALGLTWPAVSERISGTFIAGSFSEHEAQSADEMSYEFEEIEEAGSSEGGGGGAPASTRRRNVARKKQVNEQSKAPQSGPTNQLGASSVGNQSREGKSNAKTSGVIGDAEVKFVPELGQIIVRGSTRDVDRVKAIVEDAERTSRISGSLPSDGLQSALTKRIAPSGAREEGIAPSPFAPGDMRSSSGGYPLKDLKSNEGTTGRGAIGGQGLKGDAAKFRSAELPAEPVDQMLDMLESAPESKPARKRRPRSASADTGTDNVVENDMGMGGMGMEMEMMGGMEMGMDDMEMMGGMDMDMGMGMGGMMGAEQTGPERRFAVDGDFGMRPSPTSKNESLIYGEALLREHSGRDRFAAINDNPFRSVTAAPLSTFSIDVDTAAYSKVRMYLMQHRQLPSPDAVRIEELVNYFHYDYAPPTDEHPFAAAMEVASCPWNPEHRLARIGIMGKALEEERPASNLVFLLDVSGSMNQPNKLPLVKQGMKMLVSRLGENDSVAIVVYAGAAGLVLDGTTGDKTKTILDSLDRLQAGGSTAGARGIQLAYQVARDNYIPGGTNRVILCTDGDFNVGVTGTDALVKLAAQNAKGNVFLTMLGFGSGNHNDEMMEEVSNKANGNYAFIDTQAEAAKVLVEQMHGTLVTIAKDVKIQVEFNPMEVQSYRLIGYENRVMAAKDFADDTKDAGEIGAGHTVTALYELVPAQGNQQADPQGKKKPAGGLRYQKKLAPSEHAESGELLTLKLRYKQPTGTTSTLIEFPVEDSGKRFDQADQDFQFASSVAAFGMLLRGSPYKGDANFDSVEELAIAGAKDDTTGYRAEFVEMVRRARELAK